MTAKQRGRHRFWALTAAASTPLAIAIALGVSATDDALEGRGAPCPLYPNAVVSLAAELHETCSLEPGSAITFAAVGAKSYPVESTEDVRDLMAFHGPVSVTSRHLISGLESRGEFRPPEIAPEAAYAQLGASGALASLLLVFVILTAIRADVPASAPFAIIYSSLGVLIFASVAGWMSPGSYPLSAGARWILPAAIAHLAFVFPRPREITRRVPGVRNAPYWIAGGLLLLELDATYRGSPSTMFLIQRIGFTAIFAAAGLLCLSSWLSMRESPSRIARGQARVFLQGLAALLAAGFVVRSLDLPGGALTAVTLTAAISPLPLGYAIASHHLFGFDAAWRRTVSHLVYLSVWSGFFFLGVIAVQERLPVPTWLRNPVVLYVAVYAVLAPIDGLRDLVKRSIDRALQPGARIWARLTEGRASQLLRLRDPLSVANACVGLALDATPGGGASVFFGDASSLRLAHADGVDACKDPVIALRAFQMASRGDVVDVNRVDTIEPETSSVCDAGVELIARIANEGRVHGLLLVSPAKKGRLQPIERIAWLRLLSLHAAAALENVRLTEQLRVSEEFAVRGRMHAELAHELGKPLGTLEVMARKLALEEAASPVVRSRAASIEHLSEQLRDIVREVLGTNNDPERVDVPSLVDRATSEITNVHGAGAVQVRPIPALPTLGREGFAVVRALTNLIDNAIRACGTGEPVELEALADGDWIEIRVSDRGCGLSPEDLDRIFEPFVTLREGGNGLGLTISRQIVEQAGGTLTLESELGVGTQARIRLPIGTQPELEGG